MGIHDQEIKFSIVEGSHVLRPENDLAFEAQNSLFDLLERNNKLNDPVEVLKRGFSITRVGGLAIKTIGGLKSGDVLETEFRDGKLISEVKSSGQFPVNE